MNIYPDKTFRVQHYIIDDSTGVDREVLDYEIEYDCRVTELSTKDIDILNWIQDSVNNVYKLYTNDYVDLKTWDKIMFDGFLHKVLRPYKPVDLSGVIAYTKFYIVRIHE